MSLFVALIYETEDDWENADKETFDRVMAGHNAFGQKHGAHLKGGEALKGSKTAKTVRGKSVTDGPFLETKEVLGGYYAIEADDIDAAVEIAKDIPHEFGCIEVREVMVFG